MELLGRSSHPTLTCSDLVLTNCSNMGTVIPLSLANGFGDNLRVHVVMQTAVYVGWARFGLSWALKSFPPSRQISKVTHFLHGVARPVCQIYSIFVFDDGAARPNALPYEVRQATPRRTNERELSFRDTK